MDSIFTRPTREVDIRGVFESKTAEYEPVDVDLSELVAVYKTEENPVVLPALPQLAPSFVPLPLLRESSQSE